MSVNDTWKKMSMENVDRALKALNGIWEVPPMKRVLSKYQQTCLAKAKQQLEDLELDARLNP